MDGHLVPASSNSKICCSLENFTLDAERWLAALYGCVRTSYGDDAAHAAADCWLRVFEERLEGSRPTAPSCVSMIEFGVSSLFVIIGRLGRQVIFISKLIGMD
jgi:hypothetical protein